MAYRTHVLYDFSIVSKAKFYVFEEDGDSISGKLTGKKELRFKRSSEFKDPLPVQINPHEFEFTYGEGKNVKLDSSSMQQIDESILSPTDSENSIPWGVPIIKPAKGRPEPGEAMIRLNYDIYDEYNVRTMDGIDPTSTFSLESESATSLKRLSQIAGNGKYCVLFKWGDIEYFGPISSVKVTYTAFSRWGHALKADADITIKNQPLGYNKYGVQEKPTESGRLGVASTAKIKLSEAKEIVKLAAQVASQAASQALR